MKVSERELIEAFKNEKPIEDDDINQKDCFTTNIYEQISGVICKCDNVGCYGCVHNEKYQLSKQESEDEYFCCYANY